MKRTTLLGILFFCFAFAVVGGVLYYNSERRNIPIVFAPQTMLGSLWGKYKLTILEPKTLRALDASRDNITTSEGQSYTMLRAVWMDDKATFDTAWKWTKDNLRRDDNLLFSWLFGRRPDGSYGVLSERGGANSASDADTDIALALIFAHARWGDQAYLNEARALLADIWKHEVVHIKGIPYLAANNVEKDSPDRIIVNPSYLSPYAYRIFATVDKARPWGLLVDSSYVLLEKSAALGLDTKKSVGLPPDWIAINRTTGAVTAAPGTTLKTDYGFDAIRTPWRLALDWQWNEEERAHKLLGSMGFLAREYRTKGMLASTYSHDGKVVLASESPAVYGGSIGALMVTDPDLAKEMYLSKLQVLYTPDTSSWKNPLSYYDDNWAWFGMALYHGMLRDLSLTSGARAS